jgi:glycosyltransferase involved in cell wall biosynthesis
MMPSYLKIANIIVVPSIWEEPFGLTVLEAMAAGVPLIATRSGGIPEICKGVATLIDRDNVCENIANAINHLYNNPKAATELAQAAVTRSWTFDKDIFARKYLETITDNL